MSRVYLSCLLTLFFLTVTTPVAGKDSSKKKTEESSPQAVADTAAAIARAPTCDGALIDELQLHLTGVRCLTYFDHDCWKILAYSSVAASGTAGSIATYAYFKERSSKIQFAKARNSLSKEIAEKGSAELKERFAQALKAQDDIVDGKYLNSEKMRARALAALEDMAKKEGINSYKIRAASLAAARAGAVQGIRTVGMIGTGAAMATGPIGTAVMFLLDSVKPAGEKCVSDNGLEFVDKRPTEDGLRCEFSFDLNGPRFRSFFRQDRESQLRILENHPEICEYMKLFNEALKGNLLTELQILNKVKFTSLPTCKQGANKGVSYEVEFEGRNFTVSSIQDKETPSKVRAITIDGLKRNKMGRYSDPETGDMTIHFMDEAAGSTPYRISNFNNGQTTSLNFQSFLNASTTNRRYQEAVKVLNLSQFWTPIANTCCLDHEKEKDRKNCFRDHLPGLSLQEAEIQQRENDPDGSSEPKSDSKKPTKGQY